MFFGPVDQELLIVKSFYFFFLLSVRIAVSSDGGVLQTNGDECQPVWVSDRDSAICGVLVGAVLGEFGRQVAKRENVTFGISSCLDHLHRSSRLDTATSNFLHGDKKQFTYFDSA
jgi:hypothetical protein